MFVKPWHDLLAFLLGWGIAFAAPLLVGFALMLWMKSMPAERLMAATGASVVALALLGMFHLSVGGGTDVIDRGDGGGVIGYAVSGAALRRDRRGRRLGRARGAPVRGRHAALLQHDRGRRDRGLAAAPRGRARGRRRRGAARGRRRATAARRSRCRRRHPSRTSRPAAPRPGGAGGRRRAGRTAGHRAALAPRAARHGRPGAGDAPGSRDRSPSQRWRWSPPSRLDGGARGRRRRRTSPRSGRPMRSMRRSRSRAHLAAAGSRAPRRRAGEQRRPRWTSPPRGPGSARRWPTSGSA